MVRVGGGLFREEEPLAMVELRREIDPPRVEPT
jgi:hypothetical protein